MNYIVIGITLISSLLAFNISLNAQSKYIRPSPQPDPLYCFSSDYGFGTTARDEDHQNGNYLSFEFSNIPENNTGFFISYFSSNAEIIGYDQTSTANEVVNSGLAGGMRLFFSKKNVFIDLGFGTFQTRSDHRKNAFPVGLVAGIGARTELTESIDLILRSRFYAIAENQSHYDDNYLQYFIGAGIQFKTCKTKIHNNGNSLVSSAFYVGNADGFNQKFFNSYGAELSLKLSDRISLIANYSHKKISIDKNYYRISQTWNDEYATGLRSYFSDDNIKPFMEYLANLNVQSGNEFYDPYGKPYKVTYTSIGLAFGSGVEIGFTETLSGMIKCNYTINDDLNNTMGMFGGVRYVL